MAVSGLAQVTIDLAPVFALDTEIEAQIPSRFEAQCALIGWTLADMTDQREAYMAAITTRSFIPRLLLKFAQGIAKAKGGPAETTFQKAIDYLKMLQATCDSAIDIAAPLAAPEQSQVIAEIRPYPFVGVTTF